MMRVTCLLVVATCVSAFVMPQLRLGSSAVSLRAVRPATSSQQQQRNVRRRRAASCLAMSSTQSQAVGSIAYDDAELSVDETVVVTYTPVEGMFRLENGLFYCGGYNDWDGIETPVMMPMLRQPDGRYRASVMIPNFAKVSTTHMPYACNY
jgi:hypothetical protein